MGMDQNLWSTILGGPSQGWVHPSRRFLNWGEQKGTMFFDPYTLTQDVVTRHRVNQTTDCDCELGGPQTIEHISWNCTHHIIKRQPIHHLLKRIQKSKPCFQYATILTPADFDLSEHLTLIQSTIIDIWQDTIRMYLQGEQPLDSAIDPTSSSSQTPSHNRLVSEGFHERNWSQLVWSVTGLTRFGDEIDPRVFPFLWDDWGINIPPLG